MVTFVEPPSRSACNCLERVAFRFRFPGELNVPRSMEFKRSENVYMSDYIRVT